MDVEYSDYGKCEICKSTEVWPVFRRWDHSFYAHWSLGASSWIGCGSGSCSEKIHCVQLTSIPQEDWYCPSCSCSLDVLPKPGLHCILSSNSHLFQHQNSHLWVPCFITHLQSKAQQRWSNYDRYFRFSGHLKFDPKQFAEIFNKSVLKALQTYLTSNGWLTLASDESGLSWKTRQERWVVFIPRKPTPNMMRVYPVATVLTQTNPPVILVG